MLEPAAGDAFQPGNPDARAVEEGGATGVSPAVNHQQWRSPRIWRRGDSGGAGRRPPTLSRAGASPPRSRPHRASVATLTASAIPGSMPRWLDTGPRDSEPPAARCRTKAFVAGAQVEIAAAREAKMWLNRRRHQKSGGATRCGGDRHRGGDSRRASAANPAAAAAVAILAVDIVSDRSSGRPKQRLRRLQRRQRSSEK